MAEEAQSVKQRGSGKRILCLGYESHEFCCKIIERRVERRL